MRERMNAKPSGQPLTVRQNHPVSILQGSGIMNTLTILEGSERETGIIHVLFLGHNRKPNKYHQTEAPIDINNYLDKSIPWRTHPKLMAM